MGTRAAIVGIKTFFGRELLFYGCNYQNANQSVISSRAAARNLARWCADFSSLALVEMTNQPARNVFRVAPLF
jgi:hypothetical protein